MALTWAVQLNVDPKIIMIQPQSSEKPAPDFQPKVEKLVLDCALMIASGGEDSQMMLAIAPRAGRHPVQPLFSTEDAATKAISWRTHDGTEESIVFEITPNKSPDQPSDHDLVVREIFANGLLVAEFPLENENNRAFASSGAGAISESEKFGVDANSVSDAEDETFFAPEGGSRQRPEPHFWVLSPAGASK